MRHILFQEAETYSVAVLVKTAAFRESEIQKHYITPLLERGIPHSGLISFNLKYNESGKAPAGFIKEYLEYLLPALKQLGTQYLLVTDSSYFKVLTKQSKAEPHLGYVLPCKIKGYEEMQVVLSLNYQQLIYDPSLQAKLELSLDTLAAAIKGTYMPLGQNIIHAAYYPNTEAEIAAALEALHQHPRLTCDIEGFSLNFDKTGIGTIAFAWNQHEGIAFACDWFSYQVLPAEGHYGYQGINQRIRTLLRQFFAAYQGELIFHNASYDLKVIIRALWMNNLMDRSGMLHGLDVMTRRLHDTKVITYLATNSTAGNVLGLKALAHEFAGNWAVEEIKDIRSIELPRLLQYNLVDCLSTWYVYDKYYPLMVQDNQEALYKGLFMDSLKLLISVELIGMPLNKKKVAETRAKLEAIQQTHLDVIVHSQIIQALNLVIQTNEMEKANAKLKKKQHPLEKFADKVFNPNSGPQLQVLLYEQMGLPVIDKTDTGLPATGADTLKKLINHVRQPEYKAILEALIGYGEVTKILSTFIPAFEEAVDKGTGDIVWLHGNFNLGGTVSGRLSSSDPNLQNLPAGSTYGKLIKECFMAPEGWIFSGADFNSLEDYISALTTKDPNKLAVYERGFDGHCLRAAYYFRDQVPHIDLNDPASVNTLKKTHPDLRQNSKGPTFALTYQGTWHTLHNTLGIPEDEARAIEANYHELYKVSDQYVQDRLVQASKDGYVDVAFGLRVRTPLLGQVIFGSKAMPYEAAAEGRTAGNALGQSYGLLNNRAAVAFMKKVWASPYREDIFVVALIHDSIYLIVRDCPKVVQWANKELIKSMQWQDLPEIQHSTVKLGANLELYWPSWATPVVLPNGATTEEIIDLCNKHKEKYFEKLQALQAGQV